jgi:hypothetical protein
MSVVRRGIRAYWPLLVAVLAAVPLAPACTSDDAVLPDPAVAPFVGEWLATSMVITSVANPDVHPDLIEIGATFSVNVQPSGQYTAILLYSGQTQTEIGQLEASGSTVTLTPSFPTNAPAATSTYAFPDADHLVLDGETEFDFNLDGTSEQATAHIELARR